MDSTTDGPIEYILDNISDIVNFIYDILSFWEDCRDVRDPDLRPLTLSSFRLIRKNMGSFIPFEKHFRTLTQLGFITIPEGLVPNYKNYLNLYNDTIQKDFAERLVIKKNRSIFLEGPAGTGKTHTVEKILSKLSMRPNFLILNTSTTGCSALLLQDGRTVHSALGNGPINYVDRKNPNSFRDPTQYGIFIGSCMLKSKYERDVLKVQNIKEAKVIRIDEVSMMSAADFMFFSALVSKICDIFTGPFGGKILILTGDLFQIPPIPAKYGPTRDLIIPGTDKFFVQSGLWKRSNIKTISLSFSYRQVRDPEYASILDRMRFGKITREDITTLSSRVISSQSEKERIQNDNTIIKIYSRNDDVDKCNERSLNQIDSKDEFLEVEQIINIKENGVEEKIKQHINSLKLSTIRLRKGCRVMITFNQNIVKGIVNGRTGVFRKAQTFQGRVLFIKVILDGDSESTLITRQSYSHKNSKGLTVYSISQFPIRLGYALTVDKSQGASLENILAETSTIFGYGRAYTLFSRVSKLENLHLLNFSPGTISAHKEMVAMFSNVEKQNEDLNTKNGISDEEFIRKASLFSNTLEKKLERSNDSVFPSEQTSYNKKSKVEQEDDLDDIIDIIDLD